mgnify:CR=1 FL=1
MADIKFLNNIDLSQNQLLNARVHVSGSAPANSGRGSIWLNSTSNELNFHNGTTFVSVLDDTTIANTQNVFTSSFVDSSNDCILRLTKSGASSGTQDIKFVAGGNVTLTPSGTNLTIAATNTNTQLSNAQVRAAVAAASDSQVFTDADHTKLDGIDISAPGFDANPVRRRIGMVFQNFALMPHRSVLDNVAMPLEIRNISKNDGMRQAAAILDIVELGAWGSKYAHELSGGMQQRVGLARALAPARVSAR